MLLMNNPEHRSIQFREDRLEDNGKWKCTLATIPKLADNSTQVQIGSSTIDLKVRGKP